MEKRVGVYRYFGGMILVSIIILSVFIFRETVNYREIERLNNEIHQNLQEIDSLRGELTALEQREDSLLSIHKNINKRQREIIGELGNGSLTRRKKLQILSSYLAFLDSVLHRGLSSDLGETVTKHSP